MWGQQREVFPGLDSGPNDSEGHYSMTLEKRPSADPTYTTCHDLIHTVIDCTTVAFNPHCMSDTYISYLKIWFINGVDNVN